MKKLLTIILAAMLLLTACSSAGAPANGTTDDNADNTPTEPSAADDPKNTIVWENTVPVWEETEATTKKSDPQKPTLADISLASGYYIDYSFIADGTGLEVEGRMLEADASRFKIMSGDLDVDVYFITPTTARLLKEQGVYTTITSEKVIEFNNSCFDYIRDFTLDDDGNTFLMPVRSYDSAVVYPKKAFEEAGISAKDIEYYDGFMKTVGEYSGNRKKYIFGWNFFGDLDQQYQEYYCDFKNKEFNYDTDIYRSIYSFLDGWIAKSPDPLPPHFSERSFMARDFLRADDILLDLGTNYSAYAEGLIENEIDPADFEYDINDWRAVHYPYVSEKVDKNFTNVVFAYINPNSTKKENAVKVLEYIAEHPFTAMGDHEYSFIIKDKSRYPEKYHPDSELFNDFYSIAENAFISGYVVPSLRDDIDDFQAGRVTMDKAIKAYAREVEMWLNE